MERPSSAYRTQNSYKPFENLFELNMRMLKNLPFFDASQLNSSNKGPFEKNMHLLIGNGQKTIEFMQDIFQNFQNAWLDCTPEPLNVHNDSERDSLRRTSSSKPPRKRVSRAQATRSKSASRH